MAEYFDETEFSARYCIPKKTAQKMRLTGTGPVFHRIGGPQKGRVLYSSADVEAWLATCRRRSTSDPGQAA